MKNRALGFAAVMLLMGSGMAMAQYYGPPQGPPPPQAYGDRDWDRVPPEFRAAQQRGFRDGIEGARRDFKNHRSPNVMNRDEYRDPHFISPPDREDYRMGFRRGYDIAVRHMYGPARY